MSTNPNMPFLPAFNPYSLEPSQILASMQNTNLTANIYEGTSKSVGAINDTQRLMTNEFSNLNANIFDGTSKSINAVNDTQRLMTSEFSNVNKNIFDTISQNAISIERNGANNLATSERVGYQVASAVERNGANAAATSERVGSQVGVAVERNGGNILSTIEKVAGEGRLTTTIVDAASRQAAADSARDIMRGVDRVGADAVGSTKDAFATLLSTIERSAGETRLATAVQQGVTDNKLTDVRHHILNDVNRSGNEIVTAGMQNFNVLNKAITDSAWENRSAQAAGFQNISEEHLRTKFDLNQSQNNHYASQLLENQKIKELLATQGANHYASSLLETQKIKEQLAMQESNHFATNLLENQKIKESLAMQESHHFATNLLENQKIKESLASQNALQFAASVSKSDGHYAGLSKQMDNHYASILLEQQKSKELISRELAEAKYEALKNKMELSKEMGECCCEVKQKIDQRTQEVIQVVDTLDRNRLRDEINTTSNENTLLKFAELGGPFGGGYGYGYGGYGREGRGSRRHHGRR